MGKRAWKRTPARFTSGRAGPMHAACSATGGGSAAVCHQSVRVDRAGADHRARIFPASTTTVCTRLRASRTAARVIACASASSPANRMPKACSRSCASNIRPRSPPACATKIAGSRAASFPTRAPRRAEPATRWSISTPPARQRQPAGDGAAGSRSCRCRRKVNPPEQPAAKPALSALPQLAPPPASRSSQRTLSRARTGSDRAEPWDRPDTTASKAAAARRAHLLRARSEAARCVSGVC